MSVIWDVFNKDFGKSSGAILLICEYNRGNVRDGGGLPLCLRCWIFNLAGH
jgi:hypothetical protein